MINTSRKFVYLFGGKELSWGVIHMRKDSLLSEWNGSNRHAHAQPDYVTMQYADYGSIIIFV